jgi:hypothetical protein
MLRQTVNSTQSGVSESLSLPKSIYQGLAACLPCRQQCEDLARENINKLARWARLCQHVLVLALTGHLRDVRCDDITDPSL